MNFETAPVHPIALSPDRRVLAVCNLADGKLELFDATSTNLVALDSIAVGVDPVAVRFIDDNEAWVANYLSDSISLLDVPTRRVSATIQTLQNPADIVFAGTPRRAFVSCAMANTIQVFDPATRQLLTNIVVEAERPKALAVSPDGQVVYAAIFESGNGTTIVGGRFRNLLFFSNAVSAASGPYGGQNPPPNSGVSYIPAMNPSLATNIAPRTGIIVRRNGSGRWLDDNHGDWTEFVSGTNAALTQRVSGWGLPDRDLAAIDASTYAVQYVTNLMNICMALDVNPVSGRIAVVGSEAINEMRFEPNLNGIFARMKLALVGAGSQTISDLNPHLDYLSRTALPDQRERSIGDPRAIIWTGDGAAAYVAGMGSRNVIKLDSAGNRAPLAPIEVGEGPCGLALDESKRRLYVFNRFSASVSVVDTASDKVIAAVPMFDPTPLNVAAGRRHLYDTRRTSGLGQASCAACHVDARMDRLAWDLGNPAGDMARSTVNHQGMLATNDYHPMKGVMVTQTLQDIIGHEPFHWRGDKEGIEAFNGTYTNLQGAPVALTGPEMRELRDLLASVRFPPNRYRNFDNSLSTNVILAGHAALGDDLLPAGAPLPNGNAMAGLSVFNAPANFCITCHTLPTGLGADAALQGNAVQPLPTGPNGEHHFPVAPRLEGSLRSKIAQFRNMADKIGMDGLRAQSRSGFGFGHDGSVDSLTRFLNGVRISRDRDVADLIAFLLSVSGSESTSATGATDSAPPAAFGRQVTLNSSSPPPLFGAMLALAQSGASRVDLIGKGRRNGVTRGWVFDRIRGVFQSDRQAESVTPNELLALAAPGNEITFTLVAEGCGGRLGVDRDSDGIFDRDELDRGSDPADRSAQPRVIAASTKVPLTTELSLYAQIPPLSAPGAVCWIKDGQPLAETNSVFMATNVTMGAAGEYSFVVSTPFQSWTSAPVAIDVVPLLVTASPASQNVRRTGTASFLAGATGVGPVAYKWFFNGRSIGAESASLVITNCGLTNEGAYTVVGSNQFGSATSAPVRLVILINPSVVTPALNQRVVVGANATFSFVIAGNPPPFGFQLRRTSTSIVTNYVSSDRTGFLTIPNAQAGDAGAYRIVVTNAANPAPGLTLDPVALAVLGDSDGDWIPDEFENAMGMNALDPFDAALDPDGDGRSNLEEYIAGTDPLNSASALKVERLSVATGSEAIIEFVASSNVMYTVERRDSLIGAWIKVAYTVAFPTNRTIAVTNDAGAPFRIYRIVAPAQR